MKNKLITTSLLWITILTLVFGIPQPASANGTSTPPGLPQAFMGSVTINGVPASAGVPVTLKTGSSVLASTTTDSQGRYGFNPVLTVPVTSGMTIDFYISGVKCASTISKPGEVTNLNLVSGTARPSPTTPPPPSTNRIINASILGQNNSFVISKEGVLTSATTLTSADGKVKLTFNANTTINITGQSLTVTPESSPSTAPANTTLLNAYNFGPNNTTFSPSINVIFAYNLVALSPGISESDLYVAFWNGSAWTDLPSTVNKQARTVTAQVSHFTVIALLGKIKSPPVVLQPVLPPVQTEAVKIAKLSIKPTSAAMGEKITITAEVTNSNQAESSYTAILSINGIKEAEQKIIIGPQKTEKLTFITSKSSAGNYTVTLGDQNASFTISEAAAKSDFPWMWVAIGGGAFLVILFAIMIVRRRSAYY